MEDFFKSVLEKNPFSSNAVSDPAGAEVDVGGIHSRQFDELIGYAEETLRERGHLGQVVWGEAGIGKSHLLARLYRWADKQRPACCVFLHNLQPSPEWLPRYVVKCVVHRLLRDSGEGFHGTPLYWLVTEAVRQSLKRYPTRDWPAPIGQARASYRRFVDERLRENPNAGVDARAVHEVLFRFFVSAYEAKHKGGDETAASLAIRWLSGDDLDRQEAALLDLRGGGDDEETSVSLPGNPAAESVLIVLAELAALSAQPFLLCFDQIDNLTEEQIRALTQFLHPLIDHARNLLVVSSGVQRKILDFVDRGAILPAAWERIAQNAQGIQLTRINRAQARQLVEARLTRHFEPFLAQPEVEQRIEEDNLFPLGTPWFEQRLGDTPEFRPRDIINWARDRWRQQQLQVRERGGLEWLARWPEVNRATVRSTAAPTPLSEAEIERRVDDEISGKIEEQIARRILEPDTLPPDTGNLSGLVESLLSQCQNLETYGIERIEHPRPLRSGRLPIYQLLLATKRNSSDELRTGIAFVATGNATSMARSLGRITEDPEPPQRVFLVYEQRQPLKLGATGKDYLEELRQRGPERFREIVLSFREYAALDAMQAVVGDARSGDLEIDLPGGANHRVSESEAVASHHRQNRYCRHALLGQLLAANDHGAPVP